MTASNDKCKFCGTTITYDGIGAWVDSTDGDGCDNPTNAHSPKGTTMTASSDEEVCKVIADFAAKNQYAITIRELCTTFGWRSSSSGKKRVDQLRRKGMVTWNEGETRTLRVVK